MPAHIQTLIPHLDRHLAIPLLDHLSELSLFPHDQIVKAQYDLVAGTNMVDYVEQFHEQAHIDTKPDFAQLRQDAISKFQKLQEQAQPVMKVIEDPEAVAKLRTGSDRDKNLEMLKADYNVSAWTQSS